MADQTDSAARSPHKGHPKMFPPIFGEADPRTPWQRFEDLASKLLRFEWVRDKKVEIPECFGSKLRRSESQ